MVDRRPQLIRPTALDFRRQSDAPRASVRVRARAQRQATSDHSERLPRRLPHELARLLKRVFEIDIEQWPQCADTLKIIAAIEYPPVIAKILTISVCPPEPRPEQRPGLRSIPTGLIPHRSPIPSGSHRCNRSAVAISPSAAAKGRGDVAGRARRELRWSIRFAEQVGASNAQTPDVPFHERHDRE